MVGAGEVRRRPAGIWFLAREAAAHIKEADDKELLQ